MIEPIYLLASGFSFVFSFIFALGGVGSAIVLVPIFHWLGFPLNEGKPTCLFINTLSMTGATVSNFRAKVIDFKLGLPVALPSLAMAPIGAYVSTLISSRLVLAIFTGFLFFSAFMMLFFKRRVRDEGEYREDITFLPLFLIGALAGFISGLLGVGGGALISPLMILSGYNPKKVAAITAFVVPFSSFTGFLSYLFMGWVNLKLLLLSGFSAYLGGFLGTKFMMKHLKPQFVKKFLALIVLLIGIKMLLKLLL